MHVQFPICLWLGSMCPSSGDLGKVRSASPLPFLWIVVDARLPTFTDMDVVMAGLLLMSRHGRCHGWIVIDARLRTIAVVTWTLPWQLATLFRCIFSRADHRTSSERCHPWATRLASSERPPSSLEQASDHCPCVVVRQCRIPGFSLVRCHIGNFIHGLHHRPSLSSLFLSLCSQVHHIFERADLLQVNGYTLML